MQDTRVEIRTSTILKIVGIGFLLYLTYLVGHILLLFFVSLLLAALIEPFALAMQRNKIPRVIAVIVTYIILFGLFALAIALLTPIIANDVPQMMDNLSAFWGDIQTNERWQNIIDGFASIQETLKNYGVSSSGNGSSSGSGTAIGGVYSTITGFFGGIFSLTLVLVMTFYLVAQADPWRKIVQSIVPDEHVPYVTQLFTKIRDKLGAWIRGQLILSVIVGVLVFIGLLILGVKYAAVLALLAALLEFIPYVGPILAAIPALFLGFSQGGIIKLLAVGILYTIIQQLENHLLVPKIMERAVGLNPIVSILAVLIGAQLTGIIGALIAIPVATALSVFLKDVRQKKETTESNA